jgi:hypothetical protein
LGWVGFDDYISNISLSYFLFHLCTSNLLVELYQGGPWI